MSENPGEGSDEKSKEESLEETQLILLGAMRAQIREKNGEAVLRYATAYCLLEGTVQPTMSGNLDFA